MNKKDLQSDTPSASFCLLVWSKPFLWCSCFEQVLDHDSWELNAVCKIHTHKRTRIVLSNTTQKKIGRRLVFIFYFSVNLFNNSVAYLLHGVSATKISTVLISRVICDWPTEPRRKDYRDIPSKFALTAAAVVYTTTATLLHVNRNNFAFYYTCTAYISCACRYYYYYVCNTRSPVTMRTRVQTCECGVGRREFIECALSRREKINAKRCLYY